jgi:hypothetical protein
MSHRTWLAQVDDVSRVDGASALMQPIDAA